MYGLLQKAWQPSEMISWSCAQQAVIGKSQSMDNVVHKYAYAPDLQVGKRVTNE